VALPAGSWYVYATTGPAGGPCVGVPFGQFPKQLTYDAANVIAWTTAPSPVTVKNAKTGSVTRPTAGAYSMVAWTGGTTMDCSKGIPSGTTPLAVQGTSYTGTFASGRWRFFEVFTPTRGTPTCSYGGTVNVGTTGTPYTLNFSTTSPPGGQ
jgi:hypothetical protein